MQIKKQQLELNMEKQTGSKLGKECVKAVYCHPRQEYWSGLPLPSLRDRAVTNKIPVFLKFTF